MSTALQPYRPSLVARARSALSVLLNRQATARAAVNVNNDFSSVGWTIIRGAQPGDFQGNGSEVRRVGFERHPVVHACIRAIADLVATVPLEIIDRPPAVKDAEVLDTHEALRLFRGEGGLQSEYRLKSRTAVHFLTYGNGFWLMERTGRRGLPQQLRIIAPERVQYAWINPDTEKIVAYDWRDVNGTIHPKVPTEDILHFRDLDATDGLFGYPRGAATLRSILADSEASEYVRQVVTNHGTPGIAVLVDGTPTPEELEAGREKWQQRWVERGGRGGAGFMAGVKELIPLGFNLNELEFPDLRAVSREDICTAFAVDPRIIGVQGRQQDGGLSGEQFREARHRLIQQSVYPVMRAIEDELNYWLMPEYGEVYVRFSEEYIAAITEDVTQTSTRVVSEVAAKIRTVEEAREAIGLDAEMPADHTMPGGMTVGDAAMNAQAMADATLEATKNPAPASGGFARSLLTRGLTSEQARALWRSFDDTARRQEGPYERTALLLFRAEAEDVTQLLLTLGLAEAAVDDAYVQAALPRIEAAYATGGAYHRAWLQRYLALIGQTVEVAGAEVGARTGLSFTLDHPRAKAIIRQRAADLVTSVTDTTRGSIREVILRARDEGLSVRATAAQIEAETFGEITAARAVTIARTETVGALNAGAFEAAQAARIFRSKRWLSQGDGRVRESHAAVDGEVVDIGAAFSNGLRYPHEPGAPASETINCRCSLTFSDEDAGA